MASRKIIWSHRAQIKRYEILEFYIDRNKSKSYSVQLNKQFNRGLRLLLNYPNMGLKTDLEGVRGLIIDNFILFYEVDKNNINVHSIWDSRQDPFELNTK